MKRFLRNNSLSLVLACLFLLFWVGQAAAGRAVYNQDAARHRSPAASWTDYLQSGHFWQATAENWESEFLQMAAYVVLTVFLYQKGSAESKDPDSPQSNSKSGESGSWLYANSLSLALAGLFFLSVALHAVGGLHEFNDERREHHEPPASLTDFIGDSEFWFQSFQNWQSEFLAVFSLVVLTIFLRQRGSPESKPVDALHSQTGK